MILSIHAVRLREFISDCKRLFTDNSFLVIVAHVGISDVEGGKMMVP